MTRRSLTQIGGRVEVWAGNDEIGRLLVSALDVDSEPSAAMQHVHGFHSYPARMHPDTANRLVRGLSRADDTVLDPFVGSGTVLVEARLLGRRAYGIDANPLAVTLAELKTNGVGQSPLELWCGAVDAIAEHAEQRRCSKAGPSRRYEPAQRAAFDPHVLLELDGLLQGIEQQSSAALAPALKLVLSSIINKVSRRRSDTNSSEFQRRLASGFAIRFFSKKARELMGRLDDYSKRLPEGSPVARIRLGDARKLPFEVAKVRAIITSPPYPGIYDYVEHHRLRLEFLELDSRHLEQHEIGAHRHFARRSDVDAEAKWATQLGACLEEMARVLLPDGTAAIMIADSAVAGRAWYADRAIRQIASRHGLSIIGGASQRREHFHAPTRDTFRATERREHLILLTRSKPAARIAVPSSPLERDKHDSVHRAVKPNQVAVSLGRSQGRPSDHSTWNDKLATSDATKLAQPTSQKRGASPKPRKAAAELGTRRTNARAIAPAARRRVPKKRSK